MLLFLSMLPMPWLRLFSLLSLLRLYHLFMVILLREDLLKLEKASYSQKKDDERKAETSGIKERERAIQSVQSQRIYLDQNEILIRNSLPLQPNFQDKVKKYFIDN